MFGGVGKSAGWATILGAVGVALCGSVSANAADLGGDCCADLEERVAELEATTARKGNRKVSLTVSGWVNEAVMGWDDGTEQNVYVGTNSLEQSRFRFTGSAKIDKEWSAGYVLEIGIQGDPSNQFNQLSPHSTNANPTSQDDALLVRKSYWYVKSTQLGQISVGQNGSATYHLLDDADVANTRNFADAEAPAVALGAFQLRSGGNIVGGTLKWTDIMRGFNNSTPGQAGRRDVVRYDSPTFEGFTVIAAWGEDDLWDAALTYKNKLGDFMVLGRVGYGESTDPGATVGAPGPTFVVGGTNCGTGPAGFECKWGGAAGSVKHEPTGLYLYGGWGKQTIDTPGLAANFDRDSTTWFIQPGIEQKWTPLGKTTIFGQYQRDEAGSNSGKTVDATIRFWQVGVVQNIESAAMDLYAIYQRTDGDVLLTGAAAETPLDAFSQVTVGALIQF